MSPLDSSNLPPEIGEYDEQRSVRAFLMWRSYEADVDGKGRNFRLSVFMYHEVGGLPEMDQLSAPDAPEWGQNRQQFWDSIWEGREFDPGHQGLIYEYFTADTVADARRFVGRRKDDVAANGLYPWSPLAIHVPASRESPAEDWSPPFVTCSADSQAACWAVAAALAKRLGPDYRFVKHYPTGGSLYATLLFMTRDDDHGVILGLGSSIHRAGEQSGRLIDSAVWDELVDGRTSVATVVGQILEEAPSSQRRHPWAEGIGLLAEIALDSALFGCDVWIDEVPETDAEFAQISAAFPGLVSSRVNREALWFVRDRDTGEPLVCVDLNASEVFTAADPKPAAVSDAALTWRSVLESRAGRVRDTRLGVSVVLSRFNRKERFFVAMDASGGDNEELHAPSLRLADDFRQKLAASIGMPVPAHAWATIDYHLNWLHAGLQWKANPGVLHEVADRYTADGVELVSGNQEDIDLIVAWTTSEGEPVVVFLEAKAYSSWTNKQVGHKMPRLVAIVGHAKSAGLPFRPVLVLAGPTPPSPKLDTAWWPEWGRGEDGQPMFMDLPVPGARLSVERVNADGIPASDGTKWKYKRV